MTNLDADVGRSLRDEKRAQLLEQCRVIAHLADALRGIHEDCIVIVKAGSMDEMLDRLGGRTASFMEQLGDMMNAMDAADEDDEWVNPIFERARELFPLAVGERTASQASAPLNQTSETPLDPAERPT